MAIASESSLSLLTNSDPNYWIDLIEKEPLSLSRALQIKSQLKISSIKNDETASKLLPLFNKIVNAFFVIKQKFDIYPWSQKKSEVLRLQLTQPISLTHNPILSANALIHKVAFGIFPFILKKEKPFLSTLERDKTNPGYVAFSSKDTFQRSSQYVYSYYPFPPTGLLPLYSDLNLEDLPKASFSNFATEEAFHSFLANPHVIEYYPNIYDGILMEQALFTFDKHTLECVGYHRAIGDIIRGLSYLNSLGIVHGDLKESNLGASIAGIPPILKIVLLDFGSATFIGSIAKPSDANYLSPQKKEATLKASISSITYLATPQDDIWSLGMICANVYMKGSTSSNIMIQDKAFNGFIGINPSFHIPLNHAHFIYSCLHYKPESRLSIEEAQCYPFFECKINLVDLDFKSYLKELLPIFEKYIHDYKLIASPLDKSPIKELLKAALKYVRINITPTIIIYFFNLKQSDFSRNIVHVQMDDTYYLLLLDAPTFSHLENIALKQFWGYSKKQIEYVSQETNEAMGDEYWDLKKNEIWGITHKATYRDIFYPSLLEYLELNDQIKLDSVLELCGGNAEFYGLLKIKLQTIQSYCILEFNQPSLDIAVENFKGDAKLTLSKGDVTDEKSYNDLKELLKAQDKPQTFDTIIGLGALTHQVMPNKEAALKALGLVYIHLNPGGHLLLRGLAASYLNEEDLEIQGFQVIETYAYKGQFYIARRP
jgi:serine/threonine protein kinase